MQKWENSKLLDKIFLVVRMLTDFWLKVSTLCCYGITMLSFVKMRNNMKCEYANFGTSIGSHKYIDACN